MNIRKKLTALCAAMALLPGAASAYDILHVANATSADYQTFVTGRGDTWTHTNNGTGAGAVGGDLDRITDFAGLNGGTGISVREYLERFDLIVIGNGIGSGNFDQTADWAALTKPVLVHTALVARASSTGVTTDRMALFSGGQGDYTYGVPNDTVRVSVSALGDAIFDSVITPTDLYAGTLAPASPATTTYGSGELIASLTNGTTTAHGIAFWEAGDTIAGGQIVAANRGFMAMRNANNSIVDLTADGRIVLGNLIDQLLVETEVIFLAPTGVTAKSGIGEIILDWTATTGAVSYNIKRSATPGGPYTTVSTAGTVTDTTYTDTGLVNDTV